MYGRCVGINNTYNFERAYQNFNMQNYSQEELEFFSLRCIKQILVSVNMLQYTKVNQGKNFGFTPREIGQLGEFGSQLILGVNMVGGLDSFIDILQNFLMLIHDMDISESENSVKKDLRYAIGYELRLMNSSSMNKSSTYFI